MSNDQDPALKMCVLEKFAPRTKYATLSAATTCEGNLFHCNIL